MLDPLTQNIARSMMNFLLALKGGKQPPTLSFFLDSFLWPTSSQCPLTLPTFYFDLYISFFPCFAFCLFFLPYLIFAFSKSPHLFSSSFVSSIITIFLLVCFSFLPCLLTFSFLFGFFFDDVMTVLFHTIPCCLIG